MNEDEYSMLTSYNNKLHILYLFHRAAGSRWITGMWWFFALIITASYTANMSTFLSNSRRSNVITDVKELAEQNKITYGAVYNASTYKFFEVRLRNCLLSLIYRYAYVQVY